MTEFLGAERPHQGKDRTFWVPRLSTRGIPESPILFLLLLLLLLLFFNYYYEYYAYDYYCYYYYYYIHVQSTPYTYIYIYIHIYIHTIYIYTLYYIPYQRFGTLGLAASGSGAGCRHRSLDSAASAGADSWRKGPQLSVAVARNSAARLLKRRFSRGPSLPTSDSKLAASVCFKRSF